MTATNPIASIESYLVNGMFGDGKTVAGNAAAYYRGAARACAQACGIDPSLVAPSDSPHLESLRRAWVDEALRHCMAERIDKGRAALREYLSQRDRVSVSARAEGDLSFSTHSLNELLVQRFQATTTIDGQGVGIVPVEVSPEIEATRARAIGLVRRSVPRLAEDVFRAVPHAVLYRADQPFSGYTNAAPLFIFVGERMFEHDSLAAELLMHECLHQKLNDISVVRSLFRPGYDDAQSAKIPVPWSFGSNKTRWFTADRTFAAFHVYTHQTLLYLGMAQIDSPWENVVLSWARAAHFARATCEGDIVAELGHDGHRLAAWLSRAVTDLGRFRLPDGSLLSQHAGEYASTETAAYCPPRAAGGVHA